MACRRFSWFSFFALALAILILPLRWLMAAAISCVLHELGHYVALRLCGVTVNDFRMGPGGAILQVGQMNRWQELICALAGPIAGLLILPFARFIPRCAVCAFFHSTYNLLPVYPLDGGRVVRCICASQRVCTIIEWVCIGLIAFAGLYGSIGLRLGFVPLIASSLTIQRALAGKGLAKQLEFRYNRGRIYE